MKQKFLKFLLNKWTLIIAGVLIIAIAGTVVTALNWNNWFGAAEETEGVSSSDLFWNVNRFDYIYQDSKVNTQTRERDKNDGTYHVLFCNLTQQGRAVNRRVKSDTVLAKIDMYTLMGLKFDDDGVVVDVVPMEDMGYDISVARAYVSGEVKEGEPINLNTSERGDGIKFKVDIPATVPVYDLSGTSGEVGVKLTGGFADGDCVFIVSDANEKISFVLVIDRNVIGTIYYNKTRMWDTRFLNTTRKQNADGFYEVELAYEGKVEMFYTKDYDVANAIDKTAGRAFGLELDPEDPHLITGYKTTKEVTKGSIVASYYNVVSIGNGTIETRYTGSRTSPKFGDEKAYSLSTNCRAMDVTGVEGSIFGDWTEVRPGDKVQCYLNGRGKVCFIHVVGSRTVDCDLYWSTSRKWNTTTNTWTREPDADGRYVFSVISKSQPGVVQNVWTRDPVLAQEIDQKYAAPVFGLRLNGTEIIKHYKPADVVGGNSFASYYKITSIDGNNLRFTYPKDGKTAAAEKVDNPLIFNTQNLCKPDTINVGDKVHSFLNSMGEIQIIYIIEKAPVPVKTSYCNHCNQNVTWYKYAGGTANVDGRHYIMTEDMETVGDKTAFTVGSGNTVYNYTQQNVVLDLAGHKITSDYHAIKITAHSGLYLMDSVGGGVVRSTSTKYTDNGFAVVMGDASTFTFVGGTLDMSGVVQTGCTGPCVYVAPGSTFNMYDGATIKGAISNYGTATTLSGKVMTGGAVGGSVYVLGSATRTNATTGESVKLSGATFNMYGGVIEGGRTQGSSTATGGNVTVALNATFNMSGGTIRNGTTTGRGSNVFLNGTMNLSGNAKITNGTLYINSNGTFNVGTLKDGASISVERATVGVFAKNVANAEAYKNYFTTKNSNYAIVADAASKTLSIVYKGEEHVHAADGKSGTGEEVHYEALNQSLIDNIYSGKMPTLGSYFLTEDITVTAQSSNTGDINICYNGHTVTINSNNSDTSRIYLLGYTLADNMDRAGTASATVNFCDCKGFGGMVKTDPASKTKGGMLLVHARHKLTLNIYDGVYDATGINSTENGPLLWIYGAGTDDKGNSISNPPIVNIYGGHFMGGTANGKSGGTIYGDAKTVTLNILGGTIEGGVAKTGGNIGGYATTKIDGAVIKDGVAESGGNIYASGSQTIDISNTTIMGGTANDGGNIYIAGKNIGLSIKDSAIMNGSLIASANGKGENLYINGITVDVSGDMIFDGVDTGKADFYLATDAAKLKVKDLGEDTKISLDFDYTGTVVLGGADYIDKFTVIPDVELTKSGNDLVTKDDSAHEHCICGGDTDIGDHTAHEAILFQPLTQEVVTKTYGGSMPTSGNWFLAEDIELTKQAAINVDLNICLNGHKAYLESSGSDATRILMTGRGTTSTVSAVSITDCVGTGVMKKKDMTSQAIGAMLFINAQHDTSLNFYGGTFDAGEISTTKNGGLLQVTGGNKCTVNVYGGKFIGAKASQSASGTIINMSTGAVLNLYGGEFTCLEGTATNVQGIVANSGTIKVSGKVIINGENSATLRLASGVTLDVGELDEDSVIFVSAATEGVFAKNAAKYIDQFKTSSDYVISVSGNDLRIDKK